MDEPVKDVRELRAESAHAAKKSSPRGGALSVVKIIVHVFSYICYAIIGIYALICAPMITGSRPVVVLTGSMRPTYPEGTIIYYKNVPQSEIMKDDVITFKMNDTLVTHRVARIENGKYVTKGDNNNTEDGKPVSYDMVEGKVGGLAIPIVGFGVQFINEHMYVFIILIAILITEFLLSNIKSDKINISKKGSMHEKNE